MRISRDWKSRWRLESGNTARPLANPRAAIFFFVFFLAVSAAITGCSSRAVIENVVLPYGTVKHIVVASLPGGIRAQSTNGRELTSGYFVLGKNGDFRALDETEAETVGERAYAEVIILGERRPYRLDVRAYRQRRDRSTKKYSSPVYDKMLTQRFSQKVKESLANRREDRNLIDDFRAF